jgi:HlyD family secretion protein
VDIITTRKSDALSVPLAAVTTRNPEKEKENEGKQENGPPNNQNNQNNQALKKEEDKVVVFVNDGGVAKMVEVKTGVSDYDNIEITSGIPDSAEVVTGPFLVVSKKLKDGDKIRQMKKEDKKKDEEDSK